MEKLFAGCMLDAGRCLERPEYYRRAIDFIARRGLTRLLWHFADDQGCAMQFHCVADAASPHAFTHAEMRELVRYARERGVEMIPEVPSLGHTAFLTRLPRYRHLAESDEMFSSLCPVAEETRPLIEALLQETCDVFDCKIIHAGLDETNFGHHPLSKAALKTKTRTDLNREHIEFVQNVLKRRGRQMWMWADGLLHDPALAECLPRDIVQCNWRYSRHESIDTTQMLLDLGYQVVLCSASISSQQMLFPGEQFAFPNIRSLHEHQKLNAKRDDGRVIGCINTIWTPVRYIAESLWLGLDLGFALMREGSNVDVSERIEAFGADFYGLSSSTEWRSACRTVIERSPQRDEWLAALSFDENDATVIAQIKKASPQWTTSLLQLKSIRQQVTRHEREFDAFLLMVGLAELAYHIASTCNAMDADQLNESIERWQQMIAAIDAQWDVERYADDPRKYAAPIHHFDGDHVIPMMKRGLVRLHTRVAQSRAAVSSARK